LDLPDGERLLTIDGYITTDPGPHTIRLTRTDTYGSVFEGLIRPVAQATVAIRDSNGAVTFLQEIEERGRYQTPAAFRAEAGLSYSLQISLQDGKNYSSLPEKVFPAPVIDSLSYQSVKLATGNRTLDRTGVQIFSHFKDPADQSNFYYWRTGAATYILVANPELHRFPDTHPTNPRGPNPKPCCTECFIRDLSRFQRFALVSDEDFNGLSNRLPVAFIEDDGLRFKRTYRVQIQQMAVSGAAHRYLSLVAQQLSLTGSVFDQPPANIRGNMVSLDDPNEVVLGYFIAAAANSKQIYIQRDKLEFLKTPSILPDDCLTVDGASLDPPVDWDP
jgi:hypothetical protein